MAVSSGVDPLLVDAATYLAAAVIAVPVFKRLKLGSVVGYLVAGAIIGPSGVGLIEEAQSALSFAEFGVVLLLFVIGLELQPARLWRLRTEIFGLGLLQVAITMIVLAVLLGGVGPFVTNSAIAIGGALALSSTAFAIQILRERGDLTTPWGDRAFSILLFQDLAIVPLLALVSLLSPWGGGGASFTLSQIAIGLGAICGLVVVGHYLLRPLFHILAATKSDEIFTAAALLVVIGSAIAMQVAGLSMALGAFLAGVLLAESEFRHQLESDIEPFRGLLLGLLFIAIGATVSLNAVAENWTIVLLGALGLVALKFSLLFGLCRVFGSPNADALRISSVLSQGGEFGFVLFTVAMGVGLITQRESNLLTAIVTVTMAMTPIAMLLADRFLRQGSDDMSEIDLAEHAEAAPVIVVGFGRFGQVIARILKLRGYEVTLIDSSAERIRIARTFDNKVFFGDVARGDILRIAGADQARAIFLCADEHASVVQATRMLRERFPHVLIFARAHDRVAKVELRKAGADVVIREMFESSVAMAREALDRFGDGEIAEEIVEEFRRRDAELLRLQSEFGSEKGYEKMREEFDLQNENATT
ncbi:MAG: monovalent cation:proton antiporter-2 (CPA2) family protein [Pseudomonadota bacterium]